MDTSKLKISKGTVIHCPTRELAEQVLALLLSIGIPSSFWFYDWFTNNLK